MNYIKPPIKFPPLDLDRCSKEPLWCKKEIVKRLMLLLLEYTRSKPLPFMAHIEPFGPGPTRPPVIPPDTQEEIPLYSNTTDGMVAILETSWALAHAETVGGVHDDVSATYIWAVRSRENAGTYGIDRSFFDFDLSLIPSSKTVTAVSLKIKNIGTHTEPVSIQEGTQDIPISTADLRKFTGLSFGHQAWTGVYNTIDFNSLGVAYIQSKLASTAKLCARDYDHDYLNISPNVAEVSAAGMYYANTASDDDKPLLTITTS